MPPTNRLVEILPGLYIVERDDEEYDFFATLTLFEKESHNGQRSSEEDTHPQAEAN